MTENRPGAQPRPFGADELDGVSGLAPDELASETRLARELEGTAARVSVRPSSDFTERVMAVVAKEPAAAPVLAARMALRHGSFGALLASIRDAWRVTVSPAFPMAMRAQAMAMVLLVAGLAAGTGVVTAGALGVLDGDRPSPVTETTEPSVPVTEAPTAEPTAEPTQSPASIEPSSSPDPSPSIEDGTDEPAGSAEPDKTPAPTKKPVATRTPSPTRTPTPTPTPTPTDEDHHSDAPADAKAVPDARSHPDPRPGGLNPHVGDGSCRRRTPRRTEPGCSRDWVSGRSVPRTPAEPRPAWPRRAPARRSGRC